MVHVNKIEEIYKGHYQVILEFPDALVLEKVLDMSYKFIWGINHNEVRSSWSPYGHSLYGKMLDNEPVQVRNMSMEYLMNTADFIKVIPHINQTVKIVQTNIVPPHYMDLNRLQGRTKYDLLRDRVDYLFEIEIPGASDYAPMVSCNLDFIESVLKKLM